MFRAGMRVLLDATMYCIFDGTIECYGLATQHKARSPAITENKYKRPHPEPSLSSCLSRNITLLTANI